MNYPKGHRKNPWSMKDVVPDDIEDTYDTLVQNGMFRNRDPPNLAKPISGSDDDMPDCPGELADYERGIEDWINMDQMQTLKEAFPENY